MGVTQGTKFRPSHHLLAKRASLAELRYGFVEATVAIFLVSVSPAKCNSVNLVGVSTSRQVIEAIVEI